MPSSEEFQTGAVHQTHPNERNYGKSGCYARGYHLGVSNGIGGFSPCVDCEASGAPGGLLFKDMALEPERRKVHAEIPEVLTHNPNADFSELMAARMETREERDARLANAGKPEPEITVTQKQAMQIGVAYLSQQKTRENVIKWCGELGLVLVDPHGQTGPALAMAAEMEALRKRASDAEEREALLKIAAQDGARERDALVAQLKDLGDKLAAAQTLPDKVDASPEGQAAVGEQSATTTQEAL